MTIIEWPQFVQNGLSLCENALGDRRASMTIGVFDGVHLGHQLLIKRVVSYNADYVPAVITFRKNHKTENLNSAGQRDLLAFQKRLEVLESFGVQIIIAVDFTEEFRRMPGKDFLKVLLKHGKIGFFAVGDDFRCGYQLDTGVREIKEFFGLHGTPIEIVPQVMEGGSPISSSRIRRALSEGDIQLAEKMLGKR